MCQGMFQGMEKVNGLGNGEGNKKTRIFFFQEIFSE